MRIAVLGSGIAGLTAGWELSRAGQDVVVFESRQRPAMLAHSPELALDGERQTIDTLLIWKTYHLDLVDLLAEIGLSLEVLPMRSVSFSTQGDPVPFARYHSRSLLGRLAMFPRGRSLRETLAINAFWTRAWLDARRRRRRVAGGTSVGDFFAAVDDDRFRRLIYSWQNACVGFVDAATFRSMPATSMLAFQLPTLFRAPQVVREGMTELARRLAAGVELRTGHMVERVLAGDAGGPLRVRASDAAGRSATESFDHVVLAVSPRTIGRLVEGVSDRQHRLWSRFGQCPVDLYVHTSEHVMPGDRRHWCSVNYRLRDDLGESIEESIWANTVVEIAGDRPVFFSWNPIVPPPEETVLYRARLIRVLPGVGAQGCLERDLPRLQGRLNLWYCGTWAIPHRGSYLEEGVKSARRVAAGLLAAADAALHKAA